MLEITSEPPHENKLHVLWLKQLRVSPRPSIHDRGMVNAYYSTEPVGECIVLIFMRQSHEVGVRSWVQRILGTPEIVCRVIHAKDVVLVNAIVHEYESIALLCREWMLVTIILTPK